MRKFWRRLQTPRGLAIAGVLAVVMIGILAVAVAAPWETLVLAGGMALPLVGMAWENKVLDITLPADEDLSNDQYRIVVLDATSGKVRRPNAATDIPLGVLQNAPDAADQPAVVRLVGCGGISKVQAGAGAQAIGAIVGMEYVSATDAGKAIAAVATMYPVGVVIGAAAAEDDLATVLLAPLTVKA